MGQFIQPQDWVRSSMSRIDDESELFGLRYLGSQAVGIVTVSATAASGLTFEQGATVGAAAGTTGNNPGTDGVVDCSTTGAKTYHSLSRKVNAVSDWEMWLLAALPTDNVFIAATTKFLAAADQECQGAAGYAVKSDTSVSGDMQVAITNNGPSNEPHNHDGQALHELLQVKSMWGGANAGVTVKVYKCDDVNGTATEILSIGAAAAADTEKAYPSDSGIGEPIMSVDTGRLVVKFTADTWVADANDSLYCLGRSYNFGPGPRKSKLRSSY